MLGALLGQIKGIFGKPYLLAGLLPAILLVEGFQAYRNGRDGIGKDVKDILSDPSKVAGGALVSGVLILAIGLLFFAVRGPLLETLQSLPGRLLALPRRRLIERQRRFYSRVVVAIEHQEGRATVASWPTRGRGFVKPEYLPSDVSVPRFDEAMSASRAAREDIGKANLRGRHLRRALDRVEKGLVALYSLATADFNACRPEVTAWRNDLEDENAQVMIHLLNETIQRQAVEAYLTLQRFPSPQWLQPTALGNRFAALDEYAARRYGIGTSTLWKRLWGVLSAEERQDVLDGQLGVEVTANVGLAFIALATAVLGDVVRLLLDPARAPSWRAAVFIGASLMVATVSYRSAIRAVGSVSDRIVRLVDLKSSGLLEALGYAVPDSVAQRKALFKDLQRFFEQAIDPAPAWKPTSAGTPSKASGVSSGGGRSQKAR